MPFKVERKTFATMDEANAAASAIFRRTGNVAAITEEKIYAIERETYPFTVRRGNRLTVRTFKTSDAMHKFLQTGSNSAPGAWRESTKALRREAGAPRP